MEEVKEYLKQKFKKGYCVDTTNKIAFAVGYIEENEKINKKEALKIIYEIIQDKI